MRMTDRFLKIFRKIFQNCTRATTNLNSHANIESARNLVTRGSMWPRADANLFLGDGSMLNIRDLRIDPASLGRKMLLVDVMPAYEYKDGKRTETVTGYRYVVCLAEHRLEKLSVRIDGPQLMEKPEGFVDVEFTDLIVTGYESQGKLQFSAKASGIFPVD